VPGANLEVATLLEEFQKKNLRILTRECTAVGMPVLGLRLAPNAPMAA
jgi:hypothetical protein